MIPARIVRIAESLVRTSSQDKILQDVHRLVPMCKDRPQDMALVITVLATMASADQDALSKVMKLGRHADPESIEMAAKRAHAAWARGVRTPEVVAGERYYQRTKKQRKRDARKAKLADILAGPRGNYSPSEAAA